MNDKELKASRINAEEDYITTPISVLRYITDLEAELKSLNHKYNLQVKRVNELKAELNLKDSNEWISVEDRLPECWSQHGSVFASSYVLVIDSNGEQTIEQFHRVHHKKTMSFQYSVWDFTDKEWTPTHWQPLPNPPKS